MNPLNKAFVIVETCASSTGFLKDHVSFNKEEIDTKCAELNEETNAIWKAQHERNLKKHNMSPYKPSIVYMVLDLAAAVEKLSDMIYDENNTDDESR